MEPDSSRLNLRPEADTRTVEDLVDLVRRGLVRVPSFQRGLRWTADDVISLFDSIYRGYPIGSLLLRKAQAEAAKIRIGPLTIDAPETPSALWVVDGQQRLTALTAGLSRPMPVPTRPEDPWVVYFDAKTETFHAPPKTGELPSTWVPVAQLLDASVLSEWVHHWQHGGDVALRTRVFQVGKILRQYQIPLYIVETGDERLLEDIFYRINKYGQGLKWDEIHDALFGRRGGHPSTLSELADELQSLGMGRPEKDQLLSCLMASKGLDVTRNLSEHYRKDPDVLADAVQESLPALRGALSFLRRDAEIPHLRLLPRLIPLIVLTRFFAVHPDPKARSLDLLTRWTWRMLLGTSFLDERTLLRRGVAGIKEGDEEESVQALISLVPNEPRSSYALPWRFDARAADSRIALLGLSSLRPVDLQDGREIDLAALIEERDVEAFRKIFPTAGALAQSPANRVLLTGNGAARKELIQRIGQGDEYAVLRSHAVSPKAAAALLGSDSETFLEERKRCIEEAVHHLGERLAAWSRTDRPSITYLLQQAEAEN